MDKRSIRINIRALSIRIIALLPQGHSGATGRLNVEILAVSIAADELRLAGLHGARYGLMNGLVAGIGLMFFLSALKAELFTL